MKITINPLSTSSIDEAIRKLEGYEKSIEAKARELVAQLVGTGKVKAIEEIPVNTGVAMNSIAAYIENNRGFIWAGGYCAYIEFGTGTRGESSPHPSQEYQAMMQWAYNVGTTIFTTKDGRTGWYYPVGDGTYRFTEGMPSRPFMYNTAKYLKAEASRLAKEIFAHG